MARAKKTKEEELDAFVDRLERFNEDAIRIQADLSSLGTASIDVDKLRDGAEAAVCASRDLSDLALVMLSRATLEQLRMTGDGMVEMAMKAE